MAPVLFLSICCVRCKMANSCQATTLMQTQLDLGRDEKSFWRSQYLTHFCQSDATPSQDCLCIFEMPPHVGSPRQLVSFLIKSKRIPLTKVARTFCNRKSPSCVCKAEIMFVLDPPFVINGALLSYSLGCLCTLFCPSTDTVGAWPWKVSIHSQSGDMNEHTPLLQPIPCFHHLTVADTSAAVAFHCLRYFLAAVLGRTGWSVIL